MFFIFAVEQECKPIQKLIVNYHTYSADFEKMLLKKDINFFSWYSFQWPGKKEKEYAVSTTFTVI